MNGEDSGRWTIPSLFIALLALLGIVNMPGGGAGEKIPDGLEVDGREEVVDARDPGADPLGSSLRGFVPHDDQDREQLEILEPLARFYAPQIAQCGAAQHGDREFVNQLFRGMPTATKSQEPDRLKLMIAIVPHPEHSGSPYRYDDAMTAIQLAMRYAGYLMDDHRIPWRGAAADTAALPQVGLSLKVTWPWLVEFGWQRSSPELRGETTHQPGFLLFRKYPRRVPLDDTSHDLYGVLLVSETPIRGIDPAMMARALDLSLRHLDCRGDTADAPRVVVRVVGPNFSGSASSIARTLDAWVAQHRSKLTSVVKKEGRERPIEWISGAALAVRDKPLLGKRSGMEDPRQYYQYRMVTHDMASYNTFLTNYIQSQCSGPARIAILSEETTGWGYSFANSKEFLDKTELFKYTFPLNISEVRRRYQATSAAPASDRSLRTAERLDFTLGEGRDMAELVAPAAPATTAANAEMRLLHVARDIERRGIGHAILHATNMLDTIFVAEYLRAHCPDIRLYGITGEQAFTQQRRIATMRGMVFALTYPLSLEIQGWTQPTSSESETKQWAQLPLPSHAACGIYNATLAQMVDASRDKCERQFLFAGMIGYGRPYDRSVRTPPIWLVVASQRGYLPLAAGTPQEKYLWTPPLMNDPPAVPASPAHVFEFKDAIPWLILFAAASAALLVLSIRYLRSYLALFVFGLPLRRGGTDETRHRPSVILDYLGYSSLCRGDDPADIVVRRRRSSHLLFKLCAWIGYTVLAAPVWRLDLRAAIRSVSYFQSWGPVLSLVFVLTWSLALWVLVASIDVWLRGKPNWGRLALPKFAVSREPSWPWLHLLLSVGATLAILAWLGFPLWPFRWANRASLLTRGAFAGTPDEFLAALFCRRATDLASGVSPLLPILLLVGAASFWSFHRLRAIWAVAPFVGHSEFVPLPTTRGGSPSIQGLYEARERLKSVAGHGWPHLFRSHALATTLVVAIGALITVMVAAESSHGSISGLEPRWIETLLSLGLISIFWLVLPKIVHLLILWGHIEETGVATLALPMARAFDRLPAPLVKDFGSYREAIQGEDAGSLALSTTTQQCISALRDALEHAEPELEPLGVVRLRSHLDRAPHRRDASLIARACIELLQPYWKRRSLEGAYPDPVAVHPPRAPASPDPQPEIEEERPAVRRFVERAEDFVALELLRDLNRPMTMVWLRLTTVTVLSLVLLMVVNSYPFRIAGLLFGFAVLEVVFAGGVILWVLWGVQRNELIRRTTGTAGRSAFNLDFAGKLATYVVPLVLGLTAALSFATSDILRIVLGRMSV